MLPYIALWLVAAIPAYYLFRWLEKKFAIWTNSDAVIFALICLFFAPFALLVALGWAGIRAMTIVPGLSDWMDRPSKW